MSTKYEAKVVEHVVRVARTLTIWEAERSRLKWPLARERVARQAGVAPSALDRLERGTLKFVDRIGGKLDQLFLATAERQIASIRNEMALARPRGDASGSIDVAAFEAAIAQARQALGIQQTEEIE